jgi:diguanylate cyclase (GGDEF)-like protein
LAARWALAAPSIVDPRYRTAAADPRFRSLGRSATFRGLRLGSALSVLVAVSHLLTLSLLYPADADRFIWPHLLELAAAAFGLLLPARIARHAPEVIAAAVASTLVVTALAVAAIEPGLNLMAAGYLTLLPCLVALVVSWRTRVHVVWCAGYLGLTIPIVWVTWTASARSELAFFLAIAVGVVASTAGSILVQGSRIEAFLLRQRLQAVRLRAEAQRIELGHLSAALVETARTDALTGVANRLRLDEDLATLHGRLARYGQQIALIVLDIDHFKAVNDTVGHLAGDDVLRRVAAALRTTVRSGDVVYRYGGEEFLVAAAGQNLRGALALSERLRGAVEGLAIPNLGTGGSPITVSLGVTTIGPAEARRDPAAWLARADAALYEAKRTGRNRVVAASRRREPTSRTVAPESPDPQEIAPSAGAADTSDTPPDSSSLAEPRSA